MPTHAQTELEPIDAAPAPPPSPEGPLAGDPALIGVPTFLVGAIALGLTLVGYVPAEAVGAPIAIILVATGVGQLIAAVWAAALGQSAVAAIFGVFTGFWLSYAALVLGLTHGWFGVPAESTVATQELFLIAWLTTISLLTLATLRLPLAFTVLFGLITLSLALVLAATVTGSATMQTAAGVVVFSFVGVGAYLFFHVTSLATGGAGLRLGAPVVR